MNPRFLIALLVAAAPVLLAQEAHPLPVAADTGASTPTVDCFSGPTVAIPAAFIVDPNVRSDWFADAYLDGGKLGAPLAKAIPFSNVKVGASPYLQTGSFVLNLPNGGPIKPILVRLMLSVGKPDDREKSSCSILVRLTPRDLLRKTLISRLEDRQKPLRLAVFGPAPGPRTILDDWKIPYHDHGTNPPGSAPAGVLLLGEARSLENLPAPAPGASLFVLVPATAMEGDVEIRVTHDARFTLVSPTAAIAWRDDPRLHRLLAAHLLDR